jgi:[ribosomal protein S5]-alanine N-acetyltransferase
MTPFTHFPPLSTPRMDLRQVFPSDAGAVFAFKSDPEVTSRYGQEPHAALSDTQGWIERLQTGYEQRENIAWGMALKGNPGLIGVCLFWNIDHASHCAELGYELHPSCSRQGLMTEALTAIIDFGFHELDLHRIEACPLAPNRPSWELLQKLGFTHEGRLRDRHFSQDQFIDMLYYSLLKDEWKS